MAWWKCSMIIQVATGSAEADAAAIRVAGWTESWYDDGSYPIESVRRQFRVLCQRRAALLPSSGIVKGQRYQLVSPVGQAAIDTAQFPGNAGLCDYPSLSLYGRVAGTGVVNTRPMYLRGVPDAQITRGEYTPSPVYKGYVTAFCNELQEWNFRCTDKSGATVPIINIADDGTVTTSEPLTGAAQFKRVKVLKTNLAVSGNAFGGLYYIGTFTNTQSFKLTGWNKGEASGGSVRLYDFVYPSIPANAVTISRIVSKKVGRPAELFRGRRSKRR